MGLTKRATEARSPGNAVFGEGEVWLEEGVTKWKRKQIRLATALQRQGTDIYSQWLSLESLPSSRPDFHLTDGKTETITVN